MRVLAFDTAMAACSAAVLSSEGGPHILAKAYEERAQGHAEVLMPMIEGVMRAAGLAYGELDRIAVTVGPGTFTGCRIAVATGRALALAAGVPLIGATSLAVMAAVARARLPALAGGPVAVAVDARRGQIYFGVYASEGTALVEPCLATPQEAVALLRTTSQAVGSGAAALAQAAAMQGVPVTGHLPDLLPEATALARLALDRPPDGRPVKPLYLRPADAKPQAMPGVDMRR